MLVAGIGNVFLADDGFGVDVIRRIDPDDVPDDVDVADYGVRGVHLAYDLLDGNHRTLLLVDAVPTGDAAGTLAVLEIDPEQVPADGGVDAHSMTPDAVLGALRAVGAQVERVLVLGCAPGVIEERMGLSPEVEAAVPEAVRMVSELMAAHRVHHG